MSEPKSKAVFLSYAREDADAARRIAEALRGFGVEVWFDMDELRGGDAWDQKIRRQIKECGLFIPVISGGTQTRHEGYFRLEWRIAVERTHLMVAGAPFLVPVVIDDTPETPGMVPDEFMRVQWTRLRGGVPTPQFVTLVQGLLGERPSLAAGSKSASQPPIPAPAAAARSGFPGWAAALLAVAVVGLGAFELLRPSPKPAVAESAPAAASPAAPAVNEKSLAVLPFSNMSEEKDSAFFTDGIQEDILTNLALISELHVVSRTSVMQYRDTTKSIKQIGQELGVAYLLEGSVRREGNKVRVTGQLINARTDEHVWAKAYDRDLTDIFAIQGELANEIADALKAVITPEQKSVMAGRSTSSVEAYSDFLKARELRARGGLTRVNVPEIDHLLAEAVRLDPKFWEAWLETARDDFNIAIDQLFLDHAARLASGQAALTEALRFAPQDPTVLRVQALEARAMKDFPAARALLERGLVMFPNNPEILTALAGTASADRNWPEAMGYIQRALVVDPRNPNVVWFYFNALLTFHQWDKALGAAHLLQELQPGSLQVEEVLALVPFMESGSTQEADALIARMTPEQAQDREVITWENDWFFSYKGDARAYVDLRDKQGTDLNLGDEDSSLQYAEALIVLGQRDRANDIVRPLVEKLTAACAKATDDYGLWSSLAYAQSLLGQHDQAIASADHIFGMLKPTDTPLKQFFIALNMGIVYGWIGEKDKAVDIVLPYMGKPVSRYLNVHSMHSDIDYFPMRGFPRWEALIADPKNNAPLSF